jgi:hypothetical protein
MKKLIVFLFSISVFAQDYGNNAETLKLCTTLQTNSFSSDLDAENALDRILSVVGLSKNFVLAPCSDINNAVAVSFKGVRYILYDPEFMSMLSRNTSNWTNLFILAHEVGHHVNGHSLDYFLYAGDIVDAPELEKKRQQELEADEFAGFVLAKLGATLSQTTSSISNLSNEDDTYSTHPKRDKRVASIRKGFSKGFIVKAKPENDSKLNLDKIFSGSWVSKRENSLEKFVKYDEKRKGSKLDILELNDRRKITPVKKNVSSVTGYSLRKNNIILEATFAVRQRKYYFEGGMSGMEFSGRTGRIPLKQRSFLPYVEISFDLEVFYEMPKTINEGNLPGNLLKDYYQKNLKSIDGYKIIKKSIPPYIFEYSIDGKINGKLLGYLQSFSAYNSPPENMGVSFAPDTWSLNYDDVDWITKNEKKAGNSIENLKKFYLGLKSGKKLMIRITDYIYDEVNDEIKIGPYNIEKHTYIFDLKGSSKALSF